MATSVFNKVTSIPRKTLKENMSESPRSDSDNDDHPPITIQSLRQFYNIADQYVREVAEYRDAASIPALNQLRYAGHHFLRAIGDDGSIQSEEDLRRAHNHCERALYEATDAGITSALKQISRFKEDFRNIVPSEVIPSYLDYLEKAELAKDLLARSRSQTPLERAEEYMGMFRDLRKITRKLDVGRDSCVMALRKARRDSRRFYLGFAVAVVAAIFGILRYFC